MYTVTAVCTDDDKTHEDLYRHDANPSAAYRWGWADVLSVTLEASTLPLRSRSCPMMSPACRLVASKFKLCSTLHSVAACRWLQAFKSTIKADSFLPWTSSASRDADTTLSVCRDVATRPNWKLTYEMMNINPTSPTQYVNAVPWLTLITVPSAPDNVATHVCSISVDVSTGRLPAGHAVLSMSPRAKPWDADTTMPRIATIFYPAMSTLPTMRFCRLSCDFGTSICNLAVGRGFVAVAAPQTASFRG